MRDLGIFSWFGYDLPLAERLELIAHAGFQSTCLWLGPEEALFQQRQLDTMVELARRQGLEIDNVHASPDGCNSLWENSDNALIIDAYVEAIAFCQRHRIRVTVVHVTQGPTPPAMGQAGLQRIRELCHIAREREVVLAVENGGRPDYVDFILSQCDDANLGLCYDSSHDFLKGTPPTAILRKWGRRLVTVHLSDNRGEHDDHLLPEEGIVDWEAVGASFPAETYAGPVMLEVVPGPGDQRDPNEFLRKARARAERLVERLGQQSLRGDA